jgi:hypothetical protein
MAGVTDATTTKLRLEKVFSANLADSSFNMHYTMINTGPAKPWAPWEDMRVDTGGVYLFPYGGDATTGALATYTKDSLGVTWFTSNTASTLSSGTNKFYRDGSLGWYAHLTTSRVLFIKKFQPVTQLQKAPSPEDEIELYNTNAPLSASSWIEMETQGAYDTIPTNDSVNWDMKWFVRKLPDSISASVGSSALITYVAQVTNTTPPGTTAISQFSITPAVFSSMDYTNGNVTLNLEKTADISLSLVNSQGQVINRLHSGLLSEGHYTFSMNSNVPKGIYYLVLKSSDLRAFNTKMIVRF